ncbi:flavin reductase family protein [Sulfurovum sp.]|uniref:flavin reductase family protein n=1 Tax=Sulfurovum sp. TaxID=1969726 RepID=UPI00286810FC|nr:flavin reductase family protein [Sulfurovum sp.]
MLIDFKDQATTDRYKWMSQLVIPRPIAWIVTEGEVVNIAPFSYFTPLSSDPAAMIVSIGHRADGTPKDTLRNLRESKKCVLCITDESKLDMMHLSSKGLDPQQSEAEVFDIPTKKIFDDFPPMVENIKAAFFCEYLQEVDLKGSKTIPVIIEIKHLYIDETIISDKNKMSVELDTIARVGRTYAKIGEEMQAPPMP